MQAFVFDAIGDRGHTAEMPEPSPGPDEILIRVSAVGLVASDWRIRGGSRVGRQEHHFPAILGVDFAGTVVEAPGGSDRWQVGARVFGMAHKPFIGAGCLAEFVTMPHDGPVAPTPDFLTDDEAAGLVSGWLTSLAAFDEVTVSPGDIVVVPGASGGVGTVLTQLLVRRDAHVVAVTRADNRDYVRSLGAKHIVCRDEVDVVAEIKARWPAGVDVLIDLVSEGPQFPVMADIVRPGGQAASAVHAADPALFPRRDVELANIRTVPTSDHLRELADEWSRQGLVAPEIRVIPLSETADGIDLLQAGRGRGKLVVRIP